MLNLLSEYDEYLFQMIQSLSYPTYFAPFMTWVSSAGGLCIVYLTVLSLSYRTSKLSFHTVKVLFFALCLSDLLAFRLIKPHVGRLRPCHQHPEWVIQPSGSCGGHYGFPSNHAANAMVFTTILTPLLPPVAQLFLLTYTLLVGFSRVYLGVHFPLDIAFGFLLGFLISTCFRCFMRQQTSSISNNLSLSKTFPFYDS